MLTYADVFTDQGNPFYSGSIAEADATRVLNAVLEPLYSELGYWLYSAQKYKY
jgi:hypothetical protein